MKLKKLMRPALLGAILLFPISQSLLAEDLITKESLHNLATEESVTIQTRSNERYGTYLTDSHGMSLYLFMADTALTSNCYDACADAWPPLLASSADQVLAGENINLTKLSVFKRRDGKLQVAYNGWPLYYYIKDTAPGDTTGQDVMGFGAEWYLISPEGEIIRDTEGEE